MGIPGEMSLYVLCIFFVYISAKKKILIERFLTKFSTKRFVICDTIDWFTSYNFQTQHFVDLFCSITVPLNITLFKTIKLTTICNVKSPTVYKEHFILFLYFICAKRPQTLHDRFSTTKEDWSHKVFLFFKGELHNWHKLYFSVNRALHTASCGILCFSWIQWYST